ncbi:MAG: hypothetical protein ACI92G_003981 [Candidatus Pelagisphaera sp.]|jgi:hypothetical protein
MITSPALVLRRFGKDSRGLVDGMVFFRPSSEDGRKVAFWKKKIVWYFEYVAICFP